MKRFLAVVVVVLVGTALLPAQSQFGNQKVSAGSTCPPVSTPLGGDGSLYTCTGSGVLYTWTGSAWVAIAGGSGTPGNPTTSLQYNNSGAFGGISNILWDGFSLAMTETRTGGPYTGTIFAFHDNLLTFNPAVADQNGFGIRVKMLFGGSQTTYSAAGIYSELQYTAAKDVTTEIDGFQTLVNFNTSNHAEKVIGVSAAVTNSGAAADLWGVASFNNANNGTVSAFIEGFHAGPFRGSGTVPAEAAFYAEDYQDSAATNKYYFWLDSRGVYRIREDNTFDSVGQAIATLYNPLFTKYTAGTANFERCIPGCQWQTNVAVILNEAGGTGTLRDLRFVGANLQLGANTIIDNGKALRTDTTTAHTALIQGYDVDGTAYKTFVTVTNGNTPDMTLSAPAGATMTVQPSTYKSADGTTGATVTTCTGFKNGLCISGT